MRPSHPPSPRLAIRFVRPSCSRRFRVPGKVVAIGRNYREHAAEEGVEPPAAPLIFAKWPTAVVGTGAEIRWDPGLTGQVDYEAELAVVIGRTGAPRSRLPTPLTTSSATPA